ncbi:hypothetical protein C2G38_1651986 [Gigaspora rosea]|uniref:Uncharacterized protein n=1 Tax=Gigaspora rosea TaxID=44941 RepID=A0A397UWI6_9GLOM|nr:hypothetical protein C2G38_1651986 [Gigaspora rosea]
MESIMRWLRSNLAKISRKFNSELLHLVLRVLLVLLALLYFWYLLYFHTSDTFGTSCTFELLVLLYFHTSDTFGTSCTFFVLWVRWYFWNFEIIYFYHIFTNSVETIRPDQVDYVF